MLHFCTRLLQLRSWYPSWSSLTSGCSLMPRPPSRKCALCCIPGAPCAACSQAPSNPVSLPCPAPCRCTCSVLPTRADVTSGTFDCVLHGSHHVQQLKLNERFNVDVRITFTWEEGVATRSPRMSVKGDIQVEVRCFQLLHCTQPVCVFGQALVLQDHQHLGCLVCGEG